MSPKTHLRVSLTDENIAVLREGRTVVVYGENDTVLHLSLGPSPAVDPDPDD